MHSVQVPDMRLLIRVSGSPKVAVTFMENWSLEGNIWEFCSQDVKFILFTIP